MPCPAHTFLLLICITRPKTLVVHLTKKHQLTNQPTTVWRFAQTHTSFLPRWLNLITWWSCASIFGCVFIAHVLLVRTLGNRLTPALSPFLYPLVTYPRRHTNREPTVAGYRRKQIARNRSARNFPFTPLLFPADKVGKENARWEYLNEMGVNSIESIDSLKPSLIAQMTRRGCNWSAVWINTHTHAEMPINQAIYQWFIDWLQ